LSNFEEGYMAKLSGRPGKSSGSPSGPGEFEQEFHMTNSEVAAVFRELAQEIEAGGRVEASTNAWSIGVNPMQPIKLEVQYKPSKWELEIQVKLKETP
jgi:amphi-Trp domain-containing protein